jgi:hypothetical protein
MAMKLPHLTIYSDRVPSKFAAFAAACFIVIRPKYKGDVGLFEHEYVHVKQWYKMLVLWLAATALLVLVTYTYYGFDFAPVAFGAVGFHGLFYLLSKSYRLEAEAEGYAEQVKHGGEPMLMAYRLSSAYGLNITVPQAREKIEEYL